LTASPRTIAIALIYYDQRIRLEGYDIEWMMDAAGMNTSIRAQEQGTSIAIAPMGEAQG
jgi:hypothetical protein